MMAASTHDGSFYRHGLDGKKDLFRECVVGAPRAEGDARPEAVHRVPRTARVAWLGNASSTVGHLQHATASTAAQHSRHQSAAPATRLRAACALGERVACQAHLGLLELVPRNIGFVVISQEHRPCIHRTGIAIGLTHGAIDDLCLDRRLAVRIGPCIKRILQDANDVAVDGLSPCDRLHPLAIGRTRKQQLLATHVHQHLPGTAESIEEAEDRADGVLDPPVWIHRQSRVMGPDVSDRHRHSQLATSRLGDGSIEQTSPKHRKFKLAHRALEAQQKAVVGRTRIVHPFGVNDTCADQAAELDQVVPVAAVSRETRGFEAEYRADDTFADLAHEVTESGPVARATRRAPKVFIDDDHVAKAVRACEFRELVLTALALEILLDLHTRRLPDVDDRTTAEHARREFTVHHRPPRLRGTDALPPAATLRARRRRSPGSLHRAWSARACRAEGAVDGSALLSTMAGTAVFASALSCGCSSLAAAPPSNPTSRKIARTCSSASTVTRGEPIAIRAHAAASNIHAGITSPVRSGITQTKTTSPRRTSQYCTSISRPCAGCHG
jgi:hypothetical protein